MQKGFIFDINKCTGCAACRLACVIENDLYSGTPWREVHTFNPVHIGGIPVFHHSLACNHCVDPPCLINCPALAYTKNPITGAVRVNVEACIGCKYCVVACPYGARFLNPETLVADKCTFCYHRIIQGLKPACVEACPTGARSFGDLLDPDDPVRQRLLDESLKVIRPSLGTKPRVYYADLREGVR